MSNGSIKKLRTVLEFYDHMGGGSRPNNPETNSSWIPNDHTATINHASLAQPTMSDTKIRQLEAFLNTLTDKRYEHLIPALAPVGQVGN